MKSKVAYDSLIFDLDGTLWDSTSACAQGWNNALGILKIHFREITPKDIAGIMGMTNRQVFEKFFPTTGEGDRDKIAKECLIHELEAIKRSGAALYAGVEEGLSRLRGQFPLFIVSNCDQDYMETFFHCTGLKEQFQDSECHGNTGLPKGENIKLLVKRNQLQKPVYIGDTGGDHDSALSAGVDYMHVDYGFGKTTKKCLHFNEFSDLVDHFTS